MSRGQGCWGLRQLSPGAPAWQLTPPRGIPTLHFLPALGRVLALCWLLRAGAHSSEGPGGCGFISGTPKALEHLEMGLALHLLPAASPGVRQSQFPWEELW